MELNIKRSILDLADQYDTFFVDVYGVLYNGVILYENTLTTMERLRKMGKKIIIVSNTTQVSEDAKRGYEIKGMFEGVHYDNFVTSGEYLHYALSEQTREIFAKLGMNSLSVKCLFMGNAGVFADTQVIKTEAFDDADLMYVGVPRSSYGSIRIDNLVDENGCTVAIEDVVHSNWHKLRDPQGRKGTEEFALVLEKCLNKHKILIIANPDIFAYEAEGGIAPYKVVPIFSQGILGRYYEQLGGKVAHFGKPYPGIFEFARQFALPNDHIAMVGDTPWTDVLGANNFGIDSIMVTTGVCGEFIKRERDNMPLPERFEHLFGEISAKLSAVRGSNRPTHIIEKFAAD